MQTQKECAVTKEFYTYSLPVVSACNLLNQIYILTANLKFTLCQQKTQFAQIKSPKFVWSSKILNTNQRLITFFPYITLLYYIMLCQGQDGMQFHLVLHTGQPQTQTKYTSCCINTIVLLRMSTELFETCRVFKQTHYKRNCASSWLPTKNSRQVFEKYWNTKFDENPSRGSRVVPCGRTNRQTWRY